METEVTGESQDHSLEDEVLAQIQLKGLAIILAWKAGVYTFKEAYADSTNRDMISQV
jgi:hypothetical protein